MALTQFTPLLPALGDDVYTDSFEFRQIARDTIDMLDSDSSEATFVYVCEALIATIGRDIAKVFALCDVIQDLVVHRRDWAMVTAVKLYRQLLCRLDAALFHGDDFEPGAASGPDAIADRISNSCAKELELNADWDALRMANVIDFIGVAFAEGGDLLSVKAVCDLVGVMARSAYLLFPNNFPIFMDFSLSVIPRINILDPSSVHMNKVYKGLHKRTLEEPPEQATMLNDCLTIFGVAKAKPQKHEPWNDTAPIPIEYLEKSVQDGLRSVSKESDWSKPYISRLIRAIQEHTKIGVRCTIYESAFSMIEAMVTSELVYHGTNLQRLSFFLLQTGPVLDGVSSSDSPSNRLTALLDTLRRNPSTRTKVQSETLAGLCRNLGRDQIAERACTEAGDEELPTLDEMNTAEAEVKQGAGDYKGEDTEEDGDNDLYDLI